MIGETIRGANLLFVILSEAKNLNIISKDSSSPDCVGIVRMTIQELKNIDTVKLWLAK